MKINAKFKINFGTFDAEHLSSNAKLRSYLLSEGSHMLNNCNMSNRRMIMSAKMLNVYQKKANQTNKDDRQVNERTRQNSEDLYEHDDNSIYELGYD